MSDEDSRRTGPASLSAFDVFAFFQVENLASYESCVRGPPGCGHRDHEIARARSENRDQGECEKKSGKRLIEPVELAREWGVRRLGEKLSIRTRGGHEKAVVADVFPAYDDDGGLLVALTPQRGPNGSS